MRKFLRDGWEFIRGGDTQMKSLIKRYEREKKLRTAVVDDNRIPSVFDSKSNFNSF